MAEDDGNGVPHFAERLNLLFARVPRTAGGPYYSNDKAAEDLGAKGVSVTGAYLGQLRSGKKNNPSARLVAAIAELFEVPITYFFDTAEAAKIEEELDTLVAMRNAGVRGIVARSAGLSDKGIANIAAILEQIREIEGLGSSSPSSRRQPDETDSDPS